MYNNKEKGGRKGAMNIKIVTEDNERFVVAQNDLYKIVEKFKNKAEFFFSEDFIKCYQSEQIVKKIIESKNKELAYVIFTLFDYIAQYSNRLENYGEPYTIENMMKDCRISRSVAYSYIKKLTDMMIICKRKVDGKFWFFINPLYFQKSAKCKMETLRYFVGEKNENRPRK